MEGTDEPEMIQPMSLLELLTETCMRGTNMSMSEGFPTGAWVKGCLQNREWGMIYEIIPISAITEESHPSLDEDSQKLDHCSNPSSN